LGGFPTGLWLALNTDGGVALRACYARNGCFRGGFDNLSRMTTTIWRSAIGLGVAAAAVWGASAGISASRSPSSLAPELDLASLKSPYVRPDSIPFPDSNPFSEAKYELGKTLFFDPRLSGDGKIACASCHNPGTSWTDGRGRAVGHKGKILGRKSPTLFNLAWGNTFFWDGRADSLEAQALGPISSKDEMNQDLGELVAELSQIPGYRALFDKAFPGKPLSKETIAQAIATFERTVVTAPSAFDQWIAGEDGALSPSAQRGFVLFNTKAACVNCHNGWNFTNGSFADIGLLTSDEGRGKLLNDPDLAFAMKAPTLRNIAKRAPYMHDGSLPTLEAVLDHYDAGGRAPRETTRLFLKPLGLTGAEKEDLLSFLKTLDSEDEPVTAPALPQSGEKTP
jgi:cytochrome c peroxidase